MNKCFNDDESSKKNIEKLVENLNPYDLDDLIERRISLISELNKLKGESELTGEKENFINTLAVFDKKAADKKISKLNNKAEEISKKFSLDKEIYYSPYWGIDTKLAGYSKDVNSKNPLTVIDDLILSNLNLCIFDDKDWNKLFGYMKKLSKANFKIIAENWRVATGHLGSLNSCYSRIEIPLLFEVMRSVDDKDKIDNLGDLQLFLNLFDFSGTKLSCHRSPFSHNFTNIIKPDCFDTENTKKAIAMFEKSFDKKFGVSETAFKIDFSERCEAKPKTFFKELKEDLDRQNKILKEESSRRPKSFSDNQNQNFGSLE